MWAGVVGLLITAALVLWIMRRVFGCGIVFVRPFDEAYVSNRFQHATHTLRGGYHLVWPWERLLTMELLGVRGRTEYARNDMRHPIIALLPKVLYKTLVDGTTTFADYRVSYAVGFKGVEWGDRILALPPGHSLRQQIEDEIRVYIGSLTGDEAKVDVIEAETSLVKFRARRLIRKSPPPPQNGTRRTKRSSSDSDS